MLKVCWKIYKFQAQLTLVSACAEASVNAEILDNVQKINNGEKRSGEGTLLEREKTVAALTVDKQASGE